MIINLNMYFQSVFATKIFKQPLTCFWKYVFYDSVVSWKIAIKT